MDGMELFKKLAQCEDKEQMQRVIEAHNESQKPQTNADRIRAMSNEDLADYLAELGSEANNGVIYSDRPEEWLEWLKQPAEGDVNNG